MLVGSDVKMELEKEFPFLQFIYEVKITAYM